MTQKPSGSYASYSQIRYLMKRLNTALNKRLREGRPSQFYRVCREELRSISRELSEKKKKSPVKHRRTFKKPNLRRTRTKPAPDVVCKAPNNDISHHSLAYHQLDVFMNITSRNMRDRFNETVEKKSGRKSRQRHTRS